MVDLEGLCELLRPADRILSAGLFFVRDVFGWPPSGEPMMER